MKLSDFDYELGRERIAQWPLAERDASRMLVLERKRRHWEDRLFRELPEMLRGDELVVVNNARVLPARLLGRRKGICAERVGQHSRARREFLRTTIEVLLTRQVSPDLWEALVRPGRKVRIGERIVFGEGELEAEIVGRSEFGLRQVRLSAAGDLMAAVERLGHTPLPPYIHRADEPGDRERYQTIFATRSGAVAAPTAGLHFTPEILRRLQARGVELSEITMYVGLGTFQPIRSERIEDHRMHSESYEIPEATAAQIEHARSQGRPILAVGTSVVRALEDAAQKSASVKEPKGASGWGGPGRGGGVVEPGKGEAEIFIYPGHTFRVVDQLLTNFHLPKSSLLVLVSAFASRELILTAYHHAIDQQYRFYSYGDCMLIR